MRVQDHVKLSAAVALVALPCLGIETWVPLASSLLIDVDHYLWHAVAHRDPSLRSAVRHFGQADPPRLPQARLLHHPLALGTLLLAAAATRSRTLWLILAGAVFHVGLDLFDVAQLASLKRQLSDSAGHACPDCGTRDRELQLHTIHFAVNPLERYDPGHFMVLCPNCHEAAHDRGGPPTDRSDPIRRSARLGTS